MSGCPEWRERILEADLEELGGARHSELSAHLGACPACGALADAVLRTNAGLARSLEAATRDDVDVDGVLARLGHGAAPDAGVRATTGPPRVAPWLPLAAAALLAALLALPAPEPPLDPVPPATPTAPPAVEVPAGRNVVVIPTADPQITVLWFF